MKKQFQPWKQLRGEEKEQEVYRLLTVIEQMDEPEDPQEYELTIGLEKKLLEEQVSFEREERYQYFLLPGLLLLMGSILLRQIAPRSVR